MQLKEYKNDSYEFTEKTSNIARQLSLAGIAIIWIFKITKFDKPLIPEELIMPLSLFISSLFFDFIQYLVSSLIWFFFFTFHEYKNGGNTEADIKSSEWLSLPGWVFFILKIIFLIYGYILLFNYLLFKI